MLYFSLIVAGLVLLAAHAAARPAPHPVRWGLFLVTGIGLGVLPVCGGMLLTVVAGLGLLLALGLTVWPILRERGWRFLPLSTAAFVISYGLAAWYASDAYRRAVRLREQYPFMSMADRVPEPRRGAMAIGTAGQRFTWFDEDLRHEYFQNYQLKYLHDATIDTFVNSPGFGVARVVRFPVEGYFRSRDTRHPGPPPQPHAPGSPWLAADGFEPALDGRPEFDSLHWSGLMDFVNPEGWGYVRSRREVAGFLPHAFRRVPESKAWRVASVELVGLLRHADLVVYVTDRLPAMAHAATAPTRSPDHFETTALAAIRTGDDGFAGRRGDEVRFVGAVRSAAACVACHGGERGDLLGAFSYRLRPTPGSQ